MGLFFNWDKGDIGFSLSDKLGMDSKGNLLHKLSNHLAMDLNTGEINIISGWKKNKDDNNKIDD